MPTVSIKSQRVVGCKKASMVKDEMSPEATERLPLTIQSDIQCELRRCP